MKTLKIAKGDPHNYPKHKSTELRSRVGHSALSSPHPPHPLSRHWAPRSNEARGKDVTTPRVKNDQSRRDVGKLLVTQKPLDPRCVVKDDWLSNMLYSRAFKTTQEGCTFCAAKLQKLGAENNPKRSRTPLRHHSEPQNANIWDENKTTCLHTTDLIRYVRNVFN